VIEWDQEMVSVAGGLSLCRRRSRPRRNRQKIGANAVSGTKREMKDSHSASLEEICWQGSTIG
jgi:hypothetical protein